MPYIIPAQRESLNEATQHLAWEIGRMPRDNQSGMTNYVISRILMELFGGSYDEYNTAIGVLESAKLEFYRKQVGPYEDVKMAENGALVPGRWEGWPWR